MKLTKAIFEELKSSLSELLKDNSYKESTTEWLKFYEDLLEGKKETSSFLTSNDEDKKEISVRVLYPFSLNPIPVLKDESNFIENCIKILSNPLQTHTNIWVATTMYPSEVNSVIRIMRLANTVPVLEEKSYYGKFY